MSARSDRLVLAGSRVLVVGVGGLGCPASLALARAGVGTIGLVDDDVVEFTNLHRQVLFREDDVGSRKVDAASASLRLAVPDVRIEAHPTHVLPQNAVELMSRYDVVLEGADNFATKFLCADAAKAAKRPIVQASAVRWYGTALAVGPLGGPCYRCIFEDLPEGGGPNCSDAGVMAPVVGVIAAVQADLAISILHGARVFGTLATFDGKALIARRRSVEPRPGCALCGSAPSIRGVDSARYVTASREHRSKRAC